MTEEVCPSAAHRKLIFSTMLHLNFGLFSFSSSPLEPPWLYVDASDGSFAIPCGKSVGQPIVTSSFDIFHLLRNKSKAIAQT